MLIPCSSQKNTDGDTELVFGFYVWFEICGFVYSSTVLYYVHNSTETGWDFYLWKPKRAVASIAGFTGFC